MNEVPTNAPRGGRHLIIVVVSAACVLAVAEWSSSRLVSNNQPAPNATTTAERPDNVTLVRKEVAALPEAEKIPSVWVIGNSHTYSLPGMRRGERLRTNETGIFIDRMAEQLGRDDSQLRTNFYLLSYPNFLPFEMLTRVGHLLYKGHRPTIVFLGITWRNIARDTQPRHQIFLTYRDAEFCGAFRRMLADPRVDAAPEVVDEVLVQRRRVERDEEQERLQSDSDRMDSALTEWMSRHLTLMGSSADLRAYLYRTMTDRAQRMWSDRKSVEYAYDLVDHDYEFNLQCLQALVRLLTANGAEVICYFAPERSDLPLLMDPDRQAEFITLFAEEAERLGIEVLDARTVVPNEYWGWEGESPDRSHFTQPGHERLSRFLYEQAARKHTWKKLAQP